MLSGIGGLGHLGIQCAQKLGSNVAAIGRGPQIAVLAKKLGASVSIASAATCAAAELQKLGGAHVILATAPSGKAMSSLVDGLGMNGRLMVVGAAPAPIEVIPVRLIFVRRSMQVWSSGMATDSEDTLRFAALTGVRAAPRQGARRQITRGVTYARPVNLSPRSSPGIRVLPRPGGMHAGARGHTRWRCSRPWTGPGWIWPSQK